MTTPRHTLHGIALLLTLLLAACAVDAYAPPEGGAAQEDAGANNAPFNNAPNNSSGNNANNAPQDTGEDAAVDDATPDAEPDAAPDPPDAEPPRPCDDPGEIELGARCGPCNDGVWACVEDLLICDGATQTTRLYRDDDGDGRGDNNDYQALCAPTGAYTATQGGDCNDGNSAIFTGNAEACDGLDNDCDGAADEGVLNACGACGSLPASPGDPCGQCGDGGGTWACQGGQLACQGANVNACGGCLALDPPPGQGCSVCGVTRCDGEDATRCDDPGQNACGGCGNLAQPPGGACGQCGRYVCDGNDATRCDDPGLNACGGCAALGATPGQPCGQCGAWTCDGPNNVRCDDPGQNACGGCGVLSGAPGDRCGECGTLRCDGDDALTCEDPGANVCGGCGVISGTLGGTCGECGLDRLECDGTDALRCSGNTPCPLAMVRVAAGTFTMGSPGGEPGRPGGNKERQHQVTLTRAFRAATTELTQGVWRAVTGDLPPIPLYINGAVFCEACPVYGVSWYDAVEFANAISQRDGLTACYTFSRDADDNITRVEWDTTCTGYRLPTEAEWEYMTRAGTTTAVYNGDIRINDVDGCKQDQNGNVLLIAWTCQDNVQTPQLVRLATANAWGLYDSSGNVAEWTWDKHVNDHPSSAQTDPTEGTVNACPGTGSDCNRTVRGGAWRDGADKVRSAARVGMDGRTAQPTVGLRLVRTLFE